MTNILFRTRTTQRRGLSRRLKPRPCTGDKIEAHVHSSAPPTMLQYATPNAAPDQCGHFMHNLLLFGRVLQGLGLPARVPAMMDVAQALAHIELGRRHDFKFTLRSLLVRRREDLPLFDEAFDTFWRKPSGQGTDLILGELLQQHKPQKKHIITAPALQDEAAAIANFDDARDAQQMIELTRTFSDRELLRHKDFGEMSAEELTEVRLMMSRMMWQVGERKTRRRVPGPAAVLDVRRTLRASLRHGGEVLLWQTRTPKLKPRPLVVIADISGSMERYTRLLLEFSYGLAMGLSQRVESFVFATRLTRITRQLHHKTVADALKDVSASVQDWSGGTRIGECLRRFNFDWGRRVLNGGAVVLLISDGWDRGEPSLLADEMARLHRNCHRLIWLNPLLGMSDYEPLTRGMQAALPHVDDFLAVHNLASLESLAQTLAKLRHSRS